MRADLYKKYVVPSYKGFNHPVPDEKTWVGATSRDTSKLITGERTSETFGDQGYTSKYWQQEHQSEQDVAAGARTGLAKLSLFGAKVSNTAFMSLYGMEQYFAHPSMSTEDIDKKVLADRKKIALFRNLDNSADMLRAKIQDSDYWLQTHPRNTVLGKLDGDAGEMVATLPLYEALGASGLLGKGAGMLRDTSPLTAKLVSNKLGMWVAKRLITVSDGYLSSLAGSGGNTTTAKQGAEVATGFALAGDAAGLLGKGAKAVIKIASAPLIKKWTANTIAMGGKPFAQEVANSAMAEEEFAAEHADLFGGSPSTGEGLEQLKRASNVQDFMAQTKEAAEVRRAKIQDFIRHTTERAKFDPVLDKLHRGEKVSLNSIAMQMYSKGLNGISKAQRALVLAKRMELIEQAAKEAPAHLPELLHDEKQENLTAVRKSNPELDAQMKLYEQKFGANFAETSTENAVTAVKKETGISNSKAAGKKVAKVTKEFEPDSSGKAISLADIMKPKKDTLAYFRNPRNRADFIEALSDRSKAGFDKVYAKLKQANGKLPFKFEKPEQRLLYNYHISHDLEPQLGGALRRSIIEQMKKVNGYQGFNNAQMKEYVEKEAAHLDNHIHYYSKTGKMYNGTNIYASTALGGKQTFTKWQNQLHSEVVKELTTKTEKALSQHPKALAGFRSSLKVIKALGSKAKTPEEYATFIKALEETSNTYIKTAKGKSISLFK